MIIEVAQSFRGDLISSIFLRFYRFQNISFYIESRDRRALSLFSKRNFFASSLSKQFSTVYLFRHRFSLNCKTSVPLFASPHFFIVLSAARDEFCSLKARISLFFFSLFFFFPFAIFNRAVHIYSKSCSYGYHRN